MFGMRASKFSIGFGPALVRFHGKNTLFQFALIPFGGYVQLEGLTREKSRFSDRIGDSTGPGFDAFPSWQRAAVMLAGPMANFLIAVVTYAILFSSTQSVHYQWTRKDTNAVQAVTGRAEEAGLLPKDVIEEINGIKIGDGRDFRRAVTAAKGELLRIAVRRSPDGTAVPMEEIPLAQDEGVFIAQPVAPEGWVRLHFDVMPEDTPAGYVTGINLDVARFGTHGVVQSIRMGMKETGIILGHMGDIVKGWFKGTQAVQLASPYGVSKQSADKFEKGQAWFISFMAILSLNLGVINLFPLPALDGGRLLFLGIEMVSRRPVPRRIETVIHGIGALCLMILMVVIVIKEILE